MTAPRVDVGSHRPWLTLLLVAGAALRLSGLDSMPFEQDELYTLRDARDLGATAGGAPGIAGRPLYYLLQHALLEVMPPTPFLLRLPAVIFGLLGIWALYQLVRRRFGSGAGLAAAALVALSPWHLYMSQFARYWSLVFLWATAAFLLLPRAMDSDRKRHYVAALAVVVGGLLTHPTFVFPFIGFVPALHLVDREGRVGIRLPSRNAWVALWGPLLAFVATAYALLSLTGEQDALQNWGGRGFGATLRLIPAMVQWADPVFVTVAVLGMLLLVTTPGPDRRWGLAALAGAAAAALLLFVASFRTDVYADYGTSALPLLFMSAAAGLSRIDRSAELRRGTVLMGGTLVVLVAMLPGTVSHLIDGTRFDFRAAFQTVAASDPDALVVGGPAILARYYAAELETREMPGRVETLDRWASEEPGGFWLITSHRRRGMLAPSEAFQAWVDGNCRVVDRIGRTRLDFRSYRLEVARCTATSGPRRLEARR